MVYWIRGDSCVSYLSWPQAWRSGNLGDWIDTVDTYAFILYFIEFYILHITEVTTIQAPSTHFYPATPRRYSP
jgi:hypothetical protein